MKIDKDFVLKFGEHTFTADEIETIKISGGWFSMKGIEKDGIISRIETRLKDVEFLSLPPSATSKKYMTGDPIAWKECDKLYQDFCNITNKEPEPKTATEVCRIANEKWLREEEARKAFVESMEELPNYIEQWKETVNSLQADFTACGKKLSEAIRKYNRW